MAVAPHPRCKRESTTVSAPAIVFDSVRRESAAAALTLGGGSGHLLPERRMVGRVILRKLIPQRIRAMTLGWLVAATANLGEVPVAEWGRSSLNEANHTNQGVPSKIYQRTNRQ